MKLSRVRTAYREQSQMHDPPRANQTCKLSATSERPLYWVHERRTLIRFSENIVDEKNILRMMVKVLIIRKNSVRE